MDHAGAKLLILKIQLILFLLVLLTSGGTDGEIRDESGEVQEVVQPDGEQASRD